MVQGETHQRGTDVVRALHTGVAVDERFWREWAYYIVLRIGSGCSLQQQRTTRQLMVTPQCFPQISFSIQIYNM